MRIQQNLWKSKKLRENPWKSEKIREDLWSSEKFCDVWENVWKSEKLLQKITKHNMLHNMTKCNKSQHNLKCSTFITIRETLPSKCRLKNTEAQRNMWWILNNVQHLQINKQKINFQIKFSNLWQHRLLRYAVHWITSWSPYTWWVKFASLRRLNKKQKVLIVMMTVN